MDEIMICSGGSPVEYFCTKCRQLRLSPGGLVERCGNCSNKDLIIGPIGTIDKDALIRKMDGLKE